jgi:hypothetical protein
MHVNVRHLQTVVNRVGCSFVGRTTAPLLDIVPLVVVCFMQVEGARVSGEYGISCSAQWLCYELLTGFWGRVIITLGTLLSSCSTALNIMQQRFTEMISVTRLSASNCKLAACCDYALSVMMSGGPNLLLWRGVE